MAAPRSGSPARRSIAPQPATTAATSTTSPAATTTSPDTSGGSWSAGRGYDLASGLGTPDAGPLVTALCADSIRLASVGGQSSAVGAAVGVALHAADLHGARLRYTASGLPPGVRIRPDSGQLTGRPGKPGRYRVHVAVRDGRGARAGQLFSWSVGALPRITDARLTGSAAARRLAVTVASGRHAPWLRRVRVRLPAGLSVSGSARALVRARHQHDPPGSRVGGDDLAGLPFPVGPVLARGERP